MIDSDELTTYAANPQHSNFITPNFLYPDGSLFQFDMEPRYVLEDWTSVTIGGVYGLPPMQRLSLPYVYNGWTNWCDKFQKDYRFSSQSDTNATATLFPEVHDPWMYCEYLYEGTNTPNDLTGFDADGNLLPAVQLPVGIVTPQLLLPNRTVRTLNNDDTIKTSLIVGINNQPDTLVNQEVQTVYQLENKWKGSVDPFNEYWQSELEAMSWVETLPDGSSNTQFSRLNIQRRVVKYGLPVLNSGVRLNRHPVWVRSTRWGQSQNIPSRTVDLTGPKEYFKPAGIFTGKIIPHVTIEWGIPIYDSVPNPDQGTQCDIRYFDLGATNGERIFQWPVTPVGIVGKPSAVFTYPKPTDNTFVGAFEIQNMPRYNSGTQLTWNEPEYANDDLLHEGCTFWVGHNGNAFCSYYQDNQTQLAFPSYQHTTTFSDPSVPLTTLSVNPYFDSDSQAVVSVSCTNHTETNVTSLGFTLTLVRGSSGAVVGVNVGPGTIYPAAEINGFFLDTVGTVSVIVTVQSIKMPYPDPPKCAMYKGATQSDPNVDPKTEYKNAGGKCPYYTPTGPRVVHSYQAVAAMARNGLICNAGCRPDIKRGRLKQRTVRRCFSSPALPEDCRLSTG